MFEWLLLGIVEALVLAPQRYDPAIRLKEWNEARAAKRRERKRG